MEIHEFMGHQDLCVCKVMGCFSGKVNVILVGSSWGSQQTQWNSNVGSQGFKCELVVNCYINMVMKTCLELDIIVTTLWLFNIAMEAMAHRKRWFTY